WNVVVTPAREVATLSQGTGIPLDAVNVADAHLREPTGRMISDVSPAREPMGLAYHARHRMAFVAAAHSSDTHLDIRPRLNLGRSHPFVGVKGTINIPPAH